MNPLLITVLIFAVLIVLLIANVPIAIALGVTGVIFSTLLWGVSSLNMLPFRLYGMMDMFVIIAIPLFILMGCILERSGIAEDLFGMMHGAIGRWRGGLAIGTVIICTLFAAMAGVTGAATVTMAVIALPAMLKRQYDKGLSMGSIAAGGALGVLIPPSVVIIVYGMFTELSVGQLFAGSLVSGLILSLFYCVYIAILCYFRPTLGPPVAREEVKSLKEVMVDARPLVLPIILILLVLGSIFTGIATPTEASAVGALGALGCAIVRGKFSHKLLKEALLTTFSLSGMVFWLLVGGAILSSTFFGVGAPEAIRSLILGLDINPWFVIFVFMAILFVLGCFLDPGAIIMITTPFFTPVIIALGFDPLWFGILFLTNMQMAYVTPPFGMNLFYMKGAAPPDTLMTDLYKSVLPFVIIQAVGLVLIIIFPQLVMWLPNLLFS